MLIVRVLFGMAEGPVSAAGNKIINNWISRKESATAIGILALVPRSAARCPGR
ncbi:membrane transport protein [Salmonella enterica subsp. diarizonae]|uniref:Membrane transport protein n=1 Tax=Salmonella diarizonae TaxID=59204 RepID=A0A379U1L8_SALDZ|nr:membrane transport protein [Salmonella enterica subsp. diarizonae]